MAVGFQKTPLFHSTHFITLFVGHSSTGGATSLRLYICSQLNLTPAIQHRGNEAQIAAILSIQKSRLTSRCITTCPDHAVIGCSADSQAFGHEVTLGEHPGIQHIHHGHGFFLPYSAPCVRPQVVDFTIDFVQQLDIAQGLFGERAFYW